MKYEYDINKSLSNKQKHGIDFEEAKLLWNDDRMVEILTPYEDEKRFINIGIISARRARKKEIEIYES